MKTNMATDIFTPDGKTYCCGENATRDRFAKHWQTIHDSGYMNPLYIPTPEVSKQAKSYIQEKYNKEKVLPNLKVIGNGELILQYESEEIHLENNENR